MKRSKKLNMPDDYGSLFVRSVFISVAVYLAFAVITKGKALTSVFFIDAEDAFMDFFNSVRDASRGEEAYTVRRIIYPPMANLFFYLVSFITPSKYNSVQFCNRYSWVDYPINIALITAFLVLCTAALAILIYMSLKLEKKKRLLLTLAAVCSIPVLNMLERANIMIIAVIALLIFAMTYDSKSAVLREIGIIALALSFSIKLYPIIFAWILFANKRYREFFRCAVYSVAFLILPSFAFGGPKCLIDIVKNILSFSSGAPALPLWLSRISRIPLEVFTTLSYIAFALSALAFIVAPYVHKERWKIWAIGCIAFISYPALFSTYAWTLFLIPMIFFINECSDEYKKRDNLKYLLPMLIPFVFIPFSVRYVATANSMVIYLMIFVLSGVAVYDTARALFKRTK